MQSVTKDIGMEFQPIEDAMRGVFLLEIFKGDTYHIPGIEVTGLPVNKSGISLPDPTQTAGANCMASCVITGHLVAALRGQLEFQTADH